MPSDLVRLTREKVARMMDYAILKDTPSESEYLKGCDNVRKYRCGSTPIKVKLAEARQLAAAVAPPSAPWPTSAG